MASHIQYDESSNPLCQRARKFFEQYIEELFTDGAKGQVGLHGLVQFWTGYPALPVDETTIMRVKYLANNATKVLAESTTCNGTLQIPVVHEQYNTFKEYINKSVQFAKIGFRKV